MASTQYYCVIVLLLGAVGVS